MPWDETRYGTVFLTRSSIVCASGTEGPTAPAKIGANLQYLRQFGTDPRRATVPQLSRCRPIESARTYEQAFDTLTEGRG
jgi:hypothetical protein